MFLAFVFVLFSRSIIQTLEDIQKNFSIRSKEKIENLSSHLSIQVSTCNDRQAYKKIPYAVGCTTVRIFYTNRPVLKLPDEADNSRTRCLVCLFEKINPIVAVWSRTMTQRHRDLFLNSTFI